MKPFNREGKAASSCHTPIGPPLRLALTLMGLAMAVCWTGCTARIEQDVSPTAQPKIAADFFVSPDGDDEAPGTYAEPFATLARARDAVRERKQNAPGDITVALRGGRYPITETIVFDLRDSAPDGHRIIYRNYPGERPILSGGTVITNWQRTERPGNIWATRVPPGLHNLTLYTGEQRLPRARGPGFAPLHQYDSWIGPHTDTIEFPPGALRNYDDLEHAEIVARTSAAWAMNIIPLLSVDEETGIARTHPIGYSLGRIRHRPTPEDAMWVENVLDELDSPGQWVVHPDQGQLYYWPLDDTEPQDVIVPRVTELIRVEGRIDHDGPEDIPVRGLHFEGLTFMHGDRQRMPDDPHGWSLQHAWDYYDTDNAMLRFRGAEDCSVRDSHFLAAGDNGIRLDLHAQNIIIERNLFHHLGGAAAVFAGYGLGLKDVNHNNRFEHNHVHTVGEIKWDRPAVFIWQSGRNRIRGNLLHDVPYIGFSISCRAAAEGTGEGWRHRREHEMDETRLRYLGRSWRGYEGWILRERYWHGRDNLLEGNEMFSVMQRMGDGNAIYVSGTAGGNIVRENFIHSNWSPHMGSAIRCDDDQFDTLIERNIIAHSAGYGHAINIKGRNDIINNFVMDLRPAPGVRHSGLISFATYLPDGSRVKRNILHSPCPDSVRPVHAGRGRILTGTRQVVQREIPIDLSRSDLRDNLFWSPDPPSFIPLIPFTDGGAGWQSPWSAGVVAGPLTVDTELNLETPALGYRYTGKPAGNGGGVLRHRGQWVLLERELAETAISECALWVSFLSRWSPARGQADRSGVFLPLHGTEGGIYIGTRRDEFGIGTSSGFLNLASQSGHEAGQTHLIVARIDPVSHRIEAWFDPPDVRSIEALGAPHVADESRAFTAIGPQIEFRLEQSQGAQGSMLLDAVRLAWGGTDEEAFEAIITGEAAAGLSFVFDNFDLSPDAPAQPRWAEDYLIQAHAAGFETGSRIADPMWTDPAAGDFSFLPGSPAPEMGIQPLDAGKMGLDRSNWPAGLAGRSVEVSNAARQTARAEEIAFHEGNQRDREEVQEEEIDVRYTP